MRVIVVDPSRTALKFVSRILASGGHVAIPFTDGCAALDYLKSSPDVEALITNAEAPCLSGPELCWEARLIGGRRPLYIIVMSSNQDRRNLIEALDCGADDFIGKPPVAEELHARLRAAQRLELMQRELIRLATTDPLTATANRRAFFEEAEEALARVDPARSMSAIIIDIDHFKRINDVFGHGVGDDAIRAVAHVAMTEDAIVGRLGGEEFGLLFEGRYLPETVEIAERLRLAMAALKFETDKGTMTLTCSLGVSEWQAGDTIDELLKRADVALYAAKTSGRNRVVAFDSVLSANYSSAGSVVRTSDRRSN